MNCDWCNKDLDDEEKQDPRKSDDGDILCDECYEEEYEVDCPFCCENFREDKANYFIVSPNHVDTLRVPSGIYKILSKPFYADGMIIIDLYKYAIKKVAEVPEPELEHNFNSGLICDQCAEEAIESQKKSIQISG